MQTIRVIAMATETAKAAIATGRSPQYGHPAHTEVAKGHGPCRHCLQPFRVEQEQRTLFTYNPFADLAEVPLPGPVFVHTAGCERFAEDGGYPDGLRPYPVALDGYDAQQRLVIQRKAAADGQEYTIRAMLTGAEVQYVMVRDLEAGCFDFRVERGGA